MNCATTEQQLQSTSITTATVTTTATARLTAVTDLPSPPTVLCALKQKNLCNCEQKTCKPLMRESVHEDSSGIKLNTIEETWRSSSSSETLPFFTTIHSSSPTSCLLPAIENSTAIANNCGAANVYQCNHHRHNTGQSNANINTCQDDSCCLHLSIAEHHHHQPIADNDNNTNGTTNNSALLFSADQCKAQSPNISPTTVIGITHAKGGIHRTASDGKISCELHHVLSATNNNNNNNSISDECNVDGVEKSKSVSKLSERAKKRSWYSVLYPNYKTRSQEFKKTFRDVPNDERLIVDYSCALQRDILVQGRLYVSQNYFCFHAKIFGWETCLSIKWKDVTSINKEKTALVIPNAISISTASEKYFFATFYARDKSYLMLFRVWQNTLMNKRILPQEMWQWVHDYYGGELGLTTDDEDYIDPEICTIENESVANENNSDIDVDRTAVDDSSTREVEISLNSYRTAESDCNNSGSNFNNNTGGGGSSSSSAGGGSGGGGASGGGGGGSGDNSSCSSDKLILCNDSTNLITVSTTTTTTATTSGSDTKTSDYRRGGAEVKYWHSIWSSDSEMKPHKKDESVLISSTSDGGSTGESANNGSAMSCVGTAKEMKISSSTYENKRKIAKNARQRDESLSKNVEALPTDMSDSSDSDENKIPFIATTECNSPHEGRQLVHTILPINIETLFNLLFSKSKFLVEFHAMRKSSDAIFGEWITSEEGQKTRTVNITVHISAAVGPKSSKVTEYQVMRDCSKSGELYSIDVTSVNAGIPYADSFSVLLHYCLVRTVDDHTMLSVHAQIKYKKSILGFIKGFIEKNTWACLGDFYTSLLHSLQSETCIPPAKGKGRRPRRGIAAQNRPVDEILPVAQVKQDLKIKENALLVTHSPMPPIVATSQTMPSVKAGKYKWLSLSVIILLFLLILLNVILLLKLRQLEGRIDLNDGHNSAAMPNLATMEQLPSNSQDWLELMRQQELLHQTELRRWHKALQTVFDLLRKTEKILVERTRL